MPIGFARAARFLDIRPRAMDRPPGAESVMPAGLVTDTASDTSGFTEDTTVPNNALSARDEIPGSTIEPLSRLSSVDFHPWNGIGSHKNEPGIRARRVGGETTEHSTS